MYVCKRTKILLFESASCRYCNSSKLWKLCRKSEVKMVGQFGSRVPLVCYWFEDDIIYCLCVRAASGRVVWEARVGIIMGPSCSGYYWKTSFTLWRLACKQGKSLIGAHILSVIRVLGILPLWGTFFRQLVFLVELASDRSCHTIWCDGSDRNISKQRPV